tara:strand:+ start:963 stop:1214 length:252 start_codon:yes stop_codon:yes gene_type:complete
MAKTTTSKTKAAASKTTTNAEVTELQNQLRTQKENTQAIRKRVSSLVDELFVLRGELDTFKKHVTQDLSKVVDGLQTVAKNQK